MTRLEELTLMIRRGWGDVPQNQMPDDWRERWGPDKLGRTRKAWTQDRDAWKTRRQEYLLGREGKVFQLGTLSNRPRRFSALKPQFSAGRSQVCVLPSVG